MSSQDKMDPDGIRDDGVPYRAAAASLPVYAEARRQLAAFRGPYGKNRGWRAIFNRHDLRTKGAVFRRFRLFRAAIPITAFLLLTTGWLPAMSTQPDESHAHGTASSMFPLKFYDHAFDVFCYNTLRCHVIYDNRNLTPYKADEQPSGPPPSPDYRERWEMAGFGGFRNFPPPAQVTWTSLDGATHEASVDIGAIFKDQRVLYRIPDSEIPEDSWGGTPGIYLEVNDRTINVYMRAFIATKTEQIPGNKDSDFRDDVILAWTHTY